MNARKTFLISLIAISLPFNLTLAVESYEDNPDFNPHYLLSDDEMLDYRAMSIEQIRDFLQVQGGALASYTDPANGMAAYYTIWHAAQEFLINPRFLLTLLQKEQSLVTDPEPSANQYNWATGYSCYGGICLDVYKGFTKQVQSAAKKFKEYMADLNAYGKHQAGFYCTFTKWCLGVSKMTQDKITITPQTKGTTALYTYNPYQGNTVVDGYRIGANYNFWKIWNAWFENSHFRANGTLLKAPDSDDVYLITDGQRRKFASFTSLISHFDPKNIIAVPQAEIDSFAEGPEIKFAQYSLLHDPTGNIYLLVDDKLRHIADMEVFRTLGFNPEEMIEITLEDAAGLEIGAELTLKSSYPTGALIRDVETSGVYYVQNGVKYPIVAEEILQVNYPGQPILLGHMDELERYPKGSPVRFKDGTLVKAKNDGKVYVISDGQKLHIKDEAAFVSRGYAWQNIIETNSEALLVHPSGSALEALATSTPALDLIEDESKLLEVQ